MIKSATLLLALSAIVLDLGWYCFEIVALIDFGKTRMVLLCYCNDLADACCCTLWATEMSLHRESKNMSPYFRPYLRQLLTDFKNSFTGTLCGKHAIKGY